MINKEEYEEIMKKVDKQVADELKDKISPNMLGYSYYFDLRKKEILESKYKISWKTLDERNQGSMFD